ncbi:MAG: ATP-binding protein [Defluviitaleaceae bacterium]|nr:ATP-binding protein [Defluviitaleaceae bacterium]
MVKHEEMMRNLPGALFQCRGDLQKFAFTYVSEGCRALTGYSADELSIDIIHRKDLPALIKTCEATILAGIPLDTTFRIIAKDGTEKRIWLRVRVTDTDSEGMPAEFEGFATDITKQLRKETSMLANRAKYDFLARISHEIRTPMNAIVGMAELGLREDMPEKVVDYTLIIKQAGTKLMSVLSDILDFTKIEGGEMELACEEYTLSSLAHDVISIIKMQMTDTPLEFQINIDRNLPNVLIGDMARMRQVILSVLSNAVKFTDEGHVAITMCGEKSENEILLKIVIEDTGHGVTEEDLKNIFKEFTQFDVKTIEGTGLGLAIAKNLTEMMGGKIIVSSIFGVGSIFTITIPQEVGSTEIIGKLADILNAGRELNLPGKESKSLSFTAPEAKVLIVDDINTNLKVAKGLLKPYDMRVDLCPGGLEAIEAVKTAKYDLIFMDHMMPVLNGVDATLQIRALEDARTDCKNVPIIALTANAVYGVREMFLKNGFDDFLSKPIDLVRLNAVVSKWLPKHKKIIVKKSKTFTKNSQFKIKGVDTQKGIELIGGNLEIYLEIVESFLKDGRRLLYEMDENIKNDDIEAYGKNAHALKSVSGTIGADVLSEMAEALEHAVNAGNTNYVKTHNAKLKKDLETLLENIREAVNS